ncbi:MAG: Crp/Fnr family transcriptional regulator [Spirosomataceae bacterium]
MILTNLDLLHCIEALTLPSNPSIALRKVKAGALLVQQHDTLHAVYIIKTGIAKCYIQEANGKNYILEFLGAGEIIGEVELIGQTPTLSTIAALTDLTVYKLQAAYFGELLERNVEVNSLVMRELVRRLSQTALRASLQQTHPLEHTVAKLVKLLAEQHLPLSKNDLADYLGITVRSLNRTLKEMGINL